MAELATVARPYAEALFRVAKTGNMSPWSDLVSEMAEVGGNPDLKSLVENPRVTDEIVVDTMLALLKSDVSEEARNFIEVLVENGRVTLLPEIGLQFQALKNADEGAADVLIVSAFKMDDAQLSELVKVLEKKFSRKLTPTVEVDSSLIGGVCVVVGDQVLDTSVRAKLQKMRDVLV